MLRKNLWPNKASFWTIWDFVKFENHEVIKIVLIYYWIFATSVTNEFQCLGHQRLFWGEKLVVEKNCFIPNGRYKPYQNLGKKYFFCQRTFWPLNGLVLQYQYICVTLYRENWYTQRDSFCSHLIFLSLFLELLALTRRSVQTYNSIQ